MIIIVYVEILQLCFIHFLQNTSWIYTVPSIPCCLWLTWFFIGSMIISTVQFLWSHSYLVVIKYMSYVAVYTLYVGIWMINCDIYSFDWNCIRFCVYNIKGGKGRHICTRKIFAMQGYWLWYFLHAYIFSFTNIILM